MKRFNEENIILRFGVASDIHVSGSWNQPRSKAKVAHFIKVFERAAGVDNDGKTRLDALLINGDLIDAVNSPGNVQKFDVHGSKLAQNVREISHIKDCLDGGNTNGLDGGKGLSDKVQFFYVLGNHDESGRGRTGYNPEKTGYPSMHSAAIFAAIFCGWQCRDFAEDNTEFENYISDLMALAKCADEAGKKEFSDKYGVCADEALCLYNKHFGRDIDVCDEHALLFNNRHIVLSGIHFVALELSLCDETKAWFEAICKKSVSEDPKKPIFVLTHYRIKDTTFMSSDGTSKLDDILAKYSQIVIWGGHTHTPLFLETAIDQTGGFTSLESSGAAYQSNTALLSIHGEKDFPHNLPRKESHNFGNGCYVEVDGDYNVRINRIDLYRSYSEDYKSDAYPYYKGIGIYDNYEAESGSPYYNKAIYMRSPWIINDFDKPSGFTYTKARANDFPAPAFTDETTVFAQRSEGKIVISFTAAKSKDMVFRYAATLSGNGFEKTYYLTTMPHMYLQVEDIPDKVILEITDAEELEKLVGGEYTLSVVASDVWEKAGEPFEMTIEL